MNSFFIRHLRDRFPVRSFPQFPLSTEHFHTFSVFPIQERYRHSAMDSFPCTSRSSSVALFAKIHKSHLLGDHCRIWRRTFFRLFRIDRSSIHDRRDRSDQKFSAFLCQFVKKTSSRFIFIQRVQLPERSYLRYPVLLPIFIMVTPDSFSPSITACWIGAAPLYFGRRDAWIFMTSIFGHIQNRLWNNLAKSCNNNHIRFKFF